MADSFKKLDQRFLPAAATALYSPDAASGKSAIIKQIRIVNTDTAPRWFILFQSGGAAVNQITGRIVLQPQETFKDDGPITLGGGDSIQGVAEVAGVVTCTIGGDEIS